MFINPFDRHAPGHGYALERLAGAGARLVLNCTTKRPHDWTDRGQVAQFKTPRLNPVWNHVRPSGPAAKAHYETGGLVGIHPWSLNLACWDIDAYRGFTLPPSVVERQKMHVLMKAAVRKLTQDLGRKPFITGPTRRLGGMHCWVRTDKPLPNNCAMKDIDCFRCDGGFVWLWPGEAATLIDKVLAKQVPSVPAGVIAKANAPVDLQPSLF